MPPRLCPGNPMMTAQVREAAPRFMVSARSFSCSATIEEHRSHGLGASIGVRFIPHFGHFPALSDTISGCMEQE